MNLWRSSFGMVRIRLTSADPSAALSAINEQGIPIVSGKLINDLTVELSLLHKDFPKVKKLSVNRGDQVQLLNRMGLYWMLPSILRRPVLMVGFLLIAGLMTFLPGRILFVQVEGNSSLSQQQILAAAEECGLTFGASRRQIRSEGIKNALLEKLPELEWAGINTKGCVAVISVREGRSGGSSAEPMGVWSIVASMDGIIENCTARNGDLLCAPGQAVKQGQVLISAYTDCGRYLRATAAEGEIYALTRHQIQVKSPQICLRRVAKKNEMRRWSLILGKNRINLWKDSGIWGTTCGRMYEEYYITLPGGYVLPVALAVETLTDWELAESEVSMPDLSSFACSYLMAQMVAGQILSESVESGLEDGCFCLTVDYVCREMIGRVQREQIGELYAENN